MSVPRGRKLDDCLAFVGEADRVVRRQLATSEPLSKFRARAYKAKEGLSLADRKLIVKQALVLLEMNYAHLRLKEAIHAIDPIQRLRLLQSRLSEMEERKMPSELQFHEEMQDIFTSLRDLHTSYWLPDPFAQKVAILPFLIESYFESRRRKQKFLVTRLSKGFKHPTFKPGVEVLYWNGVPIERAIEINGQSQAGSNPEARFAAGLSALTNRPMIGSVPPDEDWVVITYRSLDGRQLEHKQEWAIFTPQLSRTMAAGSGSRKARKLGIDLQRAVVNEVRKVLFAPEAISSENALRRRKAKRIAVDEQSLKTSLPRIFRAYPVPTNRSRFGYIRIFNFEAHDTDEFVREFIRLMELLPQNGLIIDVRGNGGGYVECGERLLQLLTPHQIEPELFEFINTPLNLEICRVRPDDEGLSDWEQSIAQSVMTRATYSQGFNLTGRKLCNAIGQRYFGPALLIVDALCYSTTDMFAAGFQDHGIGEILGVDGNTGAGGANVWEHEDLRKLMRRQADSPFEKLPKNARMSVAFRRSVRVRNRAGMPLEDLGVVPDKRHYMTKDDLLSRNKDLINHAIKILSRKPARKLSVEITRASDGRRTIIAQARKLSRLDLYINGRQQKLRKVARDKVRSAKVTLPRFAQLRLEGFDAKNNLVAVYRRRI